MMQNFAAVPPPPVAAIVDESVKKWNERVQKIAQIDLREKAGALEMGDEFLALEKEYGREKCKQAADCCGIEWSVARQRQWVSKKIPCGHLLRESPLTFTHLRALAVLPSECLEEWGDRAIDGAWTCSRLRSEIDASGLAGEKEPRDPGCCIECEDPLALEGVAAARVIRWSEEGKRGAFCSRRCAHFYYREIFEAEGQGDDLLQVLTGSTIDAASLLVAAV